MQRVWTLSNGTSSVLFKNQWQSNGDWDFVLYKAPNTMLKQQVLEFYNTLFTPHCSKNINNSWIDILAFLSVDYVDKNQMYKDPSKELSSNFALDFKPMKCTIICDDGNTKAVTCENVASKQHYLFYFVTS